MSNTIWKLRDSEGNLASSFEDLASMGTHYFWFLFKVPNQATIAEIVKLALFFPNISGPEDNDKLMEPVSIEELKKVISGFQNDKSLGSDGWTV